MPYKTYRANAKLCYVWHMKYRLSALVFAICVSGCAADAGTQSKPLGSHAAHAGHNEPTPYDETADAKSDIAQTLAAAKAENKKGLLVFGANWCHDSRALAAHFEKPRFQNLIESNYKLVYVDVGQKNRNIDQAQKFGVSEIVGTPTVFVTNSEGVVLNSETAPTWRNAASRQEYEVWEYFESYASAY